MLLLSCTSAQDQNSDQDLKKKHERLYKDSEQITPHIQRLVNDLSKGVLVEIENEKIYAKTVLAKFYEHIGYAPAWKDLEALKQAIKALEGSSEDGLVPVDYHVDVLRTIVDKIEDSKDQGAVNHEWVAKFDLLMTDAVLLYAFHLLDGKIDPHSLDIQWNFGYAELPGGDGKLLAEAINNHILISELYDASLEKDVKYFQERHGLDSDGIIGKASFTSMNVPVEEKIDRIRETLNVSGGSPITLPKITSL